MTNLDERSIKYRDRLIELEKEKRDRAEDIKEVKKEMKASEMTQLDVDAVKEAVKLHFMEEAKRLYRKNVREKAEQLALF